MYNVYDTQYGGQNCKTSFQPNGLIVFYLTVSFAGNHAEVGLSLVSFVIALISRQVIE